MDDATNLPKGCYCYQCMFGEHGTDDDGNPIYFCHFNPDAILSWLEKDDFCSLGEIGEYQENGEEWSDGDD